MTDRGPRAPAPDEDGLRVFVSSTFLDMGPEREALAKHAFPRIRTACETRALVLTEVDLRWGVTEEQCRRQETLAVCLDEVARCNVFLGLIGDRTGTPLEAIPPVLQERHPWLGPDHVGRSLTELEFVGGILGKTPACRFAYVYAREPAPGRTAERHLETAVREAGVAVRTYGAPEDLVRLVVEDLEGLAARLRPELGPTDPLGKSSIAHTAFARRSASNYVGLAADLRRLDRHAAGRDGLPLVLTGLPGSGKTALLAAWSRLRTGQAGDGPILETGSERARRTLGRLVPAFAQAAVPAADFVLHFVGATAESTDLEASLQRLAALGARARGLDDTQTPSGAARLDWTQWMHAPGPSSPAVLVIDGADQFEDHDETLAWLPDKTPASVRLIVSVSSGRGLEALQRRGWPVHEIQDLSAERRKLVTQTFLGAYGKRLDDASRARIAGAPQAGNAEYLVLLLDELRLFGSFQGVPEEVREGLRHGSGEALAGSMLRRISADYDAQVGRELVRDACRLLWASRKGLGEPELLEMLGTKGAPLPFRFWSPIYHALRHQLARRSELLSFRSGAIRSGAEATFLTTSAARQEAHRKLASFFAGRQQGSRRVLEELPWQLARSAQWRALGDLLATPEFLEHAWPRHGLAVREYWGVVRSHTGRGVESAYDFVVEDPAAHPAIAHPVAVLLAEGGHHMPAARLSHALVEEAREAGDARAQVRALTTLAGVLLAMNEIDAALGAYSELGSLAARIGDSSSVLASLGHQALIARRMGQPERAIELHELEESLCRDSGNVVALATSLGNRALAWLEVDKPGRAEPLLIEQERLYRNLGDLVGVAASLGNQAFIKASRHDAVEALRLHREEEGILRRLDDEEGLLRCLGNLALLQMDLADYDAALAHLDERRALCEAALPRRTAALADTLLQEAFMLGVKMGQVSLARNLLRDARAILPAGGGELTDRIADLERQLA